MEEINYIKRRCIHIISEFGDGECLFNTSDVNRFINELEILEDQINLLQQDNKLIASCYQEEKALRAEISKALIDIMNYDTGEMGPENYAAHIITEYKLDE